MSARSRIVFENNNFRILRRSSGGREDPPRVKIMALQPIGREPHQWKYRELNLTIDEVFDLTEALDDLCDDIEDHG